MPPIEPMTPEQQRRYSDLLVAGEHIVLTVRKHFMGLIFIYLQALLGVVAVFSLIIITSRTVFAEDDLGGWLLAIIFFGLVILSLFLFVATYVYRQSRLLVTDQNLIQINQTSLFIRKVSRLSMSNVEDVSADQRGILATIFNYGVLLIQTAGEKPNFEFTFCPTPNHFADMVLEARQAYAQKVEE